MKSAVQILSFFLFAFPAAHACEGADAAKPERYPQLLARLEGSGGSAVSFSTDDGMILTAGGDEARVWDYHTFKPVTDPLGHGAPIKTACLAADGKTAFTIGGEEARVWDVRTSKLRADPIQLSAPVRRADVSRDGSRIATCERVDERPRGRPPATAWIICVLDTATGKRLLSLHRENLVTVVSFSPDGTQLLLVELEHGSTFAMLDVQSGKELFKPIETEYGFMPSGTELAPASFSNDGKRLVLADVEGFQVRDARTGKLIAEGGGLHEWNEKIHAVGFNFDGKKVVTVTNDGNAHLWAADTGFAVGRSADSIFGWFLSPTNSLIAGYPVGNWGGQTVGIWDLTTGKQVQTFGKDTAGAIAFSPDGTRVAVACTSAGVGYTNVWKIKTDDAQ
jgi:WD40 repeat protein